MFVRSVPRLGRVARDACPTVAGQSRVWGMLLAARSAARLESARSALSAAYGTVARCGVAAFSLLSTLHRPSGPCEHAPLVRTRAQPPPALDPSPPTVEHRLDGALAGPARRFRGKGKCPMTAEYALRFRLSGGVPALRPWPPTAAHGGRTRPGGTCLPPACVEAALAAYGPVAGWSGGRAWSLTHGSCASTRRLAGCIQNGRQLPDRAADEWEYCHR
jgi:hypothetical protein